MLTCTIATSIAGDHVMSRFGWSLTKRCKYWRCDMLAHMKRQITGESTEFTLTVPSENARQIEAAITGILALTGHKVRRFNAEGDELIPAEEVFPNSHPGSRLRGLRTREGITQKQMAEALNIRQHHISEMEKGTRSISLDMAKRIGETFNTSYKVFL
ncbi:helix-turn-helix domain-containing protein [Deltaproteobacteria bacterium OttesenSCG-928-K17]|nr:helix-turn-helix domain-containing protein [Deltaproteobacteria bacterium OttesenSCG-928-K17]